MFKLRNYPLCEADGTGGGGGAPNGTDGTNTGDNTGDNTTGANDTIVLTAAELQAKLEEKAREAGQRAADAVRNEYGHKLKDQQAQFQGLSEEAKAAKEELEKTRIEFEAERAQFEATKRVFAANVAMKKAGLDSNNPESLELAEMLAHGAKDDAEITQRVTSLKSHVERMISEAVDARFKSTGRQNVGTGGGAPTDTNTNSIFKGINEHNKRYQGVDSWAKFKK